MRLPSPSRFGANLCSVAAVVQRGLLLWVAGALFAFAAPAIADAQDVSADELARCQDFGMDDADVTARIHDLRGRIEREEPPMRHWLTVFAVLHGALLIGELVLGFTANGDGPRNEAIIGAVSSGLGLVTLMTSFPPLIGAGGTLDSLPESTPEERVAKLVRAEELIRRSAEATAFVRSPLASLLTTGYVIVMSSLLATLFQRETGAYVLAAGGVVLGQGRLLLHPDGILHEWRRYQFAHPDAGCHPAVPVAISALRLDVGPVGVPGGGGIGLSLTF